MAFVAKPGGIIDVRAPDDVVFIPPQGMNKQDYLDLIRLLSALESWGMTTAAMHKTPFPDYLLEDLGECLGKLEKEVLK